MSSSGLSRLSQISPRKLGVIGVIGATFLVVGFVMDVRIIIETPPLGDVTGTFELLWNLIIGMATIGSFLLAINNRRTERGEDNGTPTELKIEGENHDIHLNLYLSGEPSNSRGSEELTAEIEEDESDGDRSGGNADGEGNDVS